MSAPYRDNDEAREQLLVYLELENKGLLKLLDSQKAENARLRLLAREPVVQPGENEVRMQLRLLESQLRLAHAALGVWKNVIVVISVFAAGLLTIVCARG